MAFGMVERGVEWIMFIGLICLRKHIDCGLGKNRSMLVLFIGEVEFLVLLWDNSWGEQEGDGEVLARQRRRELLVSCYMREDSSESPA